MSMLKIFLVIISKNRAKRRITWDWRHDFCHKACNLNNYGYGKASFMPVPAETVTNANPRDVIRH